ncbi:hypothetical protein BTJ45_03865 [Bacillus mycoides]|nr:hypothetical protein BTJ45_03865 [Bacillus mycoides]
MGIILLLVLISFLVKKNYNLALGIYIVSVFGIPRNTHIEKMIGMGIDIKGNIFLDFRFVMISIMFIYMLFRLNKYVLKIKIPNLIIVLLFLCIFSIALIQGVLNHNPLIKSELVLYIQLFMTIVTIGLWINMFKIHILNILRMYIFGGALYSIIAIFLAIFGKGFLPSIYGEFYGTIWGDTGRVTFQNVTALFVISFFSIYIIFKTENKKNMLCALALNNIAILLSQTRSIIMLYYGCLFIIVCIIVIKVMFTKRLNLKVLASLFLGSAVILSVSIICFQKINIMETSFLADVSKRFNESGTESIDSRVYTNQYIIDSMESPILGNGIGYPLKFFSASGSVVSEVSWIDNLLLSIYSKFGIIGAIALVVLMIYGLIINIKKTMDTKEVYFLIVSLVYIPFIVICAFLTSQLIHSIQVSLLYFIILLIPNIHSENEW